MSRDHNLFTGSFHKWDTTASTPHTWPSATSSTPLGRREVVIKQGASWEMQWMVNVSYKTAQTAINGQSVPLDPIKLRREPDSGRRPQV